MDGHISSSIVIVVLYKLEETKASLPMGSQLCLLSS